MAVRTRICPTALTQTPFETLTEQGCQTKISGASHPSNAVQPASTRLAFLRMLASTAD